MTNKNFTESKTLNSNVYERLEVAKQGVFLDELKNDKAQIVVAAAVKAAHDASVKDALLRLEILEKKEKAREKAKQKK